MPSGLPLNGEHLEETGSTLLVIDTCKDVTPDINAKGTSYDSLYAALIPVQKFAQQRNIGIVLVTHTRKAVDIDNAFNMIQGSVGIQAGCDTMIMLSHDSGSKTLHLSGRRIQSDQFAFTIDDGIWKLEGDAKDYHISELRSDILSLLKEVGEIGMSTADLSDALGKKDCNVRQVLRRMVKDGQIRLPRKRGDYFCKEDDDSDGTLICRGRVGVTAVTTDGNNAVNVVYAWFLSVVTL